jgi:hypothetical protein
MHWCAASTVSILNTWLCGVHVHVCTGKDCLVAVKTTMQAINEVVGDTEGDTQATQVHTVLLRHTGSCCSVCFCHTAGRRGSPACRTRTPLSASKLP